MTIRTRKGRRAEPRALLGAQALAGAMLALCEVGLSERQRGRCVGSGISRWINVGLLTITPRYLPNARASKREVRRARQHAVSGHDDGCYAFGVSSLEIEALLLRHDGDKVAPLLLEAFFDAVGEISSARQSWRRDRAYDALEAQVCRRITPSRFERKKAGLVLNRAPNPP